MTVFDKTLVMLGIIILNGHKPRLKRVLLFFFLPYENKTFSNVKCIVNINVTFLFLRGKPKQLNDVLHKVRLAKMCSHDDMNPRVITSSLG